MSVEVFSTEGNNFHQRPWLSSRHGKAWSDRVRRGTEKAVAFSAKPFISQLNFEDFKVDWTECDLGD